MATAGTIAVWWLNAKRPEPRFPPARGIVVLYSLAMVALGGVSFLGEPRFANGWILLIAAAAIAVTTVAYGRQMNRSLDWLGAAKPSWDLRRALVRALPLAAVSAAGLGLAYEAAKVPIYPPVKIVLTGHRPAIDGFYIAETSNAVLVGTGLCDLDAEQLQSLLVVPRDGIARFVIGRSVRLSKAGQRQFEAHSIGLCSSKKRA